ncbi:LIN1-like protein [Yarrowia sp. C11]|nr:LIN1-like protein [Yarrowia sp. C11]
MSTFNSSNPLQLAPEAEETTELDQLLEEDIGGRVRAQKKGLRGIDDDSSDEEEAPKKDKKDTNGHGEDSDSDMFSEDDDKEEDKNEDPAEEEFDDEKPQFMDMDKFEGDVGTHTTVEPLVEEESDPEVDIDYYTKDDVDGLDVDLQRAKKYAPKMESFNLKQDLEEGKFDQEGNFVKNAQDEKEHQDQWLDGVSKKDIVAAKRAQESRNETTAVSKPIVSKVDLLQQLSEVLQDGETSLSALARLGKERKKLLGDDKKSMVQQIEQLTEYCDALLSRDMSNIYDMTREEVQKEYCLLTGQSVKDLKRKVDEIDDEPEEWVFRWAEGEEVHGPFTATMMKGWSEGYFTEAVQVRKIGQTTWMGHGKYD